VGDNALIFIRWLMKKFKKEHEFVNRYTRSHPHFFWYVSDRSERSFGSNYLFEVKSYRSQAVWDAHTHPILAIANFTTISIKGNISIRMNRISMRGVIARFGNKVEIVAIHYPTRQTLQAMIKNVESLRLVA